MQQVWVDEEPAVAAGQPSDRLGTGQAGHSYRPDHDSMAASLMAQGRIDAVWVSARIASPPTATSPIVGTYSWCWRTTMAFILRGCPTHTTHDPHCPDNAIPIEQRAAARSHRRFRPASAPARAPAVPVCNPAFDVTPAKLISGWVFGLAA